LDEPSVTIFRVEEKAMCENKGADVGKGGKQMGLRADQGKILTYKMVEPKIWREKRQGKCFKGERGEKIFFQQGGRLVST
jgi:hypothetical protein